MSTAKEFMISKLHELYRSDPWVEEVFTAAGLTLDTVAETMLGIYNSNWFDTMPAEWVKRYEAAMVVTPAAAQTLDDRRSAIEAKWKSSGKTDLALIQSVANSWKNGEVNVEFTDGKLQLTFKSIYGVPGDLQTLLDAIGNVKPAHIALAYTLRYLLISDINGVKTLTEMEALTLNKFAGGDA